MKSKIEEIYETIYANHIRNIQKSEFEDIKFQDINEFKEWLKGIRNDPSTLNNEGDKKLLDQFKEHITKIKKGEITLKTFGELILPPFIREYELKFDGNYPEVLFREWPRFNQNASIYPLEEGAIIVLDKGLIEFIQIGLGLILRSEKFQATYFKDYIISPLSNDTFIDEFSNVIVDLLNTGRVDQKRYLEYIITPHEGGMAEIFSKLYINIISFILAHELAHLHLEHKPIKNEVGELSLYTFMYSQSQELEADMFALKMLFDDERLLTTNNESWKTIESNRDATERLISIQCMGIIVFFEMLAWKDGVRWILKEKYTGEKLNAYFFTHPTNELRVHDLMIEMIKMFPWIENTANISGVLKDFKDKVIQNCIDL